jgi:hypothetical protein
MRYAIAIVVLRDTPWLQCTSTWPPPALLLLLLPAAPHCSAALLAAAAAAVLQAAALRCCCCCCRDEPPGAKPSGCCGCSCLPAATCRELCRCAALLLPFPSLPAAGAAAQILAGLPLLAFSMKSKVSYRIQVMSSWGMSAHQQRRTRISGNEQHQLRRMPSSGIVRST